MSGRAPSYGITPATTSQQWPVRGPIYFAQEWAIIDAALYGELNERGQITRGTVINNETLKFPIAFFDQRGVLRKIDPYIHQPEVHPPIYSCDEFQTPDKFFWVNIPGSEEWSEPLPAKLLRDDKSGTLGEMVIVGTSNSFLASGPRSASHVAGWCWDPLEIAGEPDPNLYYIFGRSAANRCQLFCGAESTLSSGRRSAWGGALSRPTKFSQFIMPP